MFNFNLWIFPQRLSEEEGLSCLLPALNETHATLVQYIKPNVDKEAGKISLLVFEIIGFNVLVAHDNLRGVLRWEFYKKTHLTYGNVGKRFAILPDTEVE